MTVVQTEGMIYLPIIIKNNMDSETSSAIRAFLHSFSLVNESFELHHLSDGLILADLLEVVKGFRLES